MPSDVNTVKTISDILLLFARGIDSTAIPRVAIEFGYSPSDLPGVDTGAWTVSAKLHGLREINDDGTKVFAYQRDWNAIGADPIEGLNALQRDLRQQLAEETARKREELATLAIAVNQMESAGALADLWPRRDQEANAEESTAHPASAS